MSTSQPTRSTTHNRKGFSFGLGCFAILLASPFLLYYGYCWGLLGRQSLLLQYLFQCNCPVASMEARYPESVDVIVPACRNAGVRLAPGGRLMYVNEEWDGRISSYLLDLETYQKIEFTILGDYMYFLTDELVLFSLNYGGDGYILDHTTGEQYPIQRFKYSHPNAIVNGVADLRLLAGALREAKYVFLINDFDLVVALTPEFPASPERNFITGRFDIPGGESDRVRLFLQEYNIAYQLIPSSLLEEVVSPDRRFVARSDGIYLIESGQKIDDGYFVRKFLSKQYFSVRGWVSDSSGVIYSKFPEPCLIELGLGIEYHRCYYEVPQPVIKLKVPEQYLSSTSTP
jgi:hypothetical protein